MERDVRSWLWDIQEAAQAIASFVQGLDATAYASQPLVHSAVERKLPPLRQVVQDILDDLARRGS